jgi:GDP-L-fucose synthase
VFYHGKKVLVTGGTGFVGFHIVQQLLQQGALVVVPLHQRAFPENGSGDRVEFVQADLFSMDDCLRVTQGVDCVFHAAGGVGAAGVGPIAQMELIRKNLVLTAQVLEASWKNNVQRILIFSSSTVYPAVDHPVKEEEIWSGQPHPSYLGYGWMRRYFEVLGKFAAAASPLQVAVIRPTAVYGRYDNFDPGTSHVIPALIKRAVEKESPFVVWGSGDEVRDFVHVTDLARASLLMVEKYAVCDPVNIGYGKAVTVKEIVGLILTAAGHDGTKVVFDASKPTTIPFRMADISLAKKVLGFEPRVSLEDGISDTVAWFRQQQVRKM